MRNLIIAFLSTIFTFTFSLSAQDTLIVAPEFPQGAEWVNSATPPSIDQFLGKVLLIAFFDLSNRDGIAVQEDISALQNKYSSELCVVGMQISQRGLIADQNALRHAVLREEINYPVMLDRQQSTSKAYSIAALPSFVVIDPIGEIAAKYNGLNSMSALDSAIALTVEKFDGDGRLSRRVVSFQTELSQTEKTVLFYPTDVTISPRDSTLFICDANHHRIIATSFDGAVKYVIGSGASGKMDSTFTEARFNKPQSIALDKQTLYIDDPYNHVIRAADLKSKTVKSIGKLTLPYDSVAVFNGKRYEPDRDNHRIRVIDTRSKDTSYLHLTNLEDLAKQEMRNFHNRPIDFQPQNIKVGISRISIALLLPDGYKLDANSPFFVNYTSSDEKVIAFTSAPDQLQLNQVNEFEIPLVANFGAADLTVDVVVYFHSEGDDKILFDVIRANLSVAVVNNGPAMFGVALNVRALPRP